MYESKQFPFEMGFLLPVAKSVLPVIKPYGESQGLSLLFRP